MSILNRIMDAIPYRERLKGEETRVERQELWCHDCGKYVQFDVDVSLNGNHVLECPNCRHEHCRVVKDGVITDIRWASRNGPTYIISNGTAQYTNVSTYSTATSSTASTFLYAAWMNTGAG